MWVGSFEKVHADPEAFVLWVPDPGGKTWLKLACITAIFFQFVPSQIGRKPVIQSFQLARTNYQFNSMQSRLYVVS